MSAPVRIAVVGDYDPEQLYHRATTESLHHAADALRLAIAVDWIPTPVPETAQDSARLAAHDGVFLAPGAPYRSSDGALAAVRFAREQGWPFFGT